MTVELYGGVNMRKWNIVTLFITAVIGVPAFAMVDINKQYTCKYAYGHQVELSSVNATTKKRIPQDTFHISFRGNNGSTLTWYQEFVWNIIDTTQVYADAKVRRYTYHSTPFFLTLETISTNDPNGGIIKLRVTTNSHESDTFRSDWYNCRSNR